jgi:hypothetical protein
MPKFYEIRLLSVAGYISLIICSFLAYVGGSILFIGLGIIPIPFIIELIITIYYIKLSINNKKVHFLCFSVIIFIIAFIVGINVDNYKTQNTRKYLINMGNIIEEYKSKNNIDFLTENDILNIGLPENIFIENYGDNYLLRYKDGTYNSETNTVIFKPRP